MPGTEQQTITTATITETATIILMGLAMVQVPDTVHRQTMAHRAHLTTAQLVHLTTVLAAHRTVLRAMALHHLTTKTVTDLPATTATATTRTTTETTEVSLTVPETK